MSQHFFKTETNTGLYVEVQIGWDKPLQYYYCVISPVIQEGEFKGELDDPIYSNLFEESTSDLDYYIGVCSRYGITVPDSLIEGVREDRKNNTVNKRIDYQH